MASSLLIVVIILGIIRVPTVTSSLVHFEQGHQYEYEYTANITLDKVDTMRLAAKVIFSFYLIQLPMSYDYGPLRTELKCNPTKVIT